MTQNLTAQEPQELPEGVRLLDRYTIIDRVASGGMASIYRATDDRLDRVVCVKLLRLELEGAGSTDGGAVYQATYSHFLREALALSKLAHPNTLRIYDFGYLEDPSSPGAMGRPFQISEFLDGGNLEQHLRARGAFSADETLAILERITGAIAEAHDQKIVHRDIKPSNILFSRVGELLMPKLADFGIAQSNLRRQSGPKDGSDPSDWDSVSSIALFSPRWAAPEQLSGAAEGPPTDVYALALVTAYMLTGRVPFDGPDVRDTFEDRVRSDELLSARLTQLGLTGDTKRTLGRSLMADPSVRVQSPLVFFDELRNVLGGARTVLPPQHAQPRKPVESVTLSVESVSARDREVLLVQPVERRQTIAGRTVRVAEVHERLELSITGPTLPAEPGVPPQQAVFAAGPDVRFRVSLVPVRDQPLRVNIKGMNCFVAKADSTGTVRPSPAVTVSEDSSVEFMSTSRKPLAKIAVSFGQMVNPKEGPSEGARGGDRVFRVSGGELVVPSSEAVYAVALDLGPGREVIVMCKRA
jgi:serine/threonine protein kinase